MNTREIKFRAWDKGELKMTSEPICYTDGPETTGLNENIINCLEYGSNFCILHCNPEVIGNIYENGNLIK